ncbi:dihydroxyacetone kinase subunit DhaK [Jiangella aurantiaca]|uniref:Dihydroxyacetone kinase subunit DhaK n=1 Tax=Jiangella aurantiaca TaxID=2530373 RepID=A0A4R5AIG6_9ACTN|nr:dihydroxyacetone kinase subunit DhaK [Jiangella aurantiaca]
MIIKKLLNDPADFVDEALEGLLLAHPGHFAADEQNPRVLVRSGGTPAGQVGIVTGGGSGHLPLFLGYVGPGLASAVAVGNVFSAQSSDAALAAIRAADSGAGVLVLIGNYTGDRLNFELAADLAEAEGRTVRIVRAADDVASAPPERAGDRRGVAGIVFAYSCVGAAAARGDALEDVVAVAERTIAATRTMGVGLSATVLPTTGRPSFEIGADEMEIGIGIHGEPGRVRGPLRPADDVADDLLDSVAAELGLVAGSRVAVLINGLGATSPEELYILARRVHHRLAALDVEVHRTLVGEFATSMEMAGASISVLALDNELTALLDAPADSPLVPRGL